MIAVLGGRGMLGSELTSRLVTHGTETVSRGSEIDITSSDQLSRFVDRYQPQWIVNCAAYTAVDRAEQEAELAAAINSTAVGTLAEVCRAARVRVLHISTDYVFDGTAREPINERQPTSPINRYGSTKLDGEELLRQTQPEHIVLRTAWLYGRHGRNFVSTMLELMANRDEITVVDDQVGSPTWTRELADAIVAIIDSDQPSFGTYHFVAHGEISWFGFAQSIQRIGIRYGLLAEDRARCTIQPVASDQFPTAARRPAYSVLDTGRIQDTYGIEPAPWEQALDSYLEELGADQ